VKIRIVRALDWPSNVRSTGYGQKSAVLKNSKILEIFIQLSRGPFEADFGAAGYLPPT